MDIKELIKIEPYKSCFEYGELVGEQQGRNDAIDECIEIVKKTTRHFYIDEVITQMEQLKEQTND